MLSNYKEIIIFQLRNYKIEYNKECTTAGASSQCYWDEIMLLKCELMLLQCYFNENTNQNGGLFPTKCVERVLNISCLVSIILDKLVS